MTILNPVLLAVRSLLLYIYIMFILNSGYIHSCVGGRDQQITNSSSQLLIKISTYQMIEPYTTVPRSMNKKIRPEASTHTPRLIEVCVRVWAGTSVPGIAVEK